MSQILVNSASTGSIFDFIVSFPDYVIACEGLIQGTALLVVNVSLVLCWGLTLVLARVLNPVLDQHCFKQRVTGHRGTSGNLIDGVRYWGRGWWYSYAVVRGDGRKWVTIRGTENLKPRPFLDRWRIGLCYLAISILIALCLSFVISIPYVAAIRIHDRSLGLRPAWETPCSLDDNASKSSR